MENNKRAGKNQPGTGTVLNEDDQAFLREYTRSLPKEDPKDPLSVWLRKVIRIAEEHAVPDLPFADLISEGNLGLTEAMMEGVTDEESLHRAVEEQILGFIREMRREREDDNRLTAQVAILSETIDKWRTDYGVKPTIDELANELGISQEKVLDILKLTGEDPESGS